MGRKNRDDRHTQKQKAIMAFHITTQNALHGKNPSARALLLLKVAGVPLSGSSHKVSAIFKKWANTSWDRPWFYTNNSLFLLKSPREITVQQKVPGLKMDLI